MPDPLTYLKSLGLAALVSALCVLVMAAMRSSFWRTAATIAAVAVGLLVGCHGLGFRWPWPPANGLSRLLVLVLPGTMAVELAAAVPRIPTGIAWFLRISLALAIPRILLHGSVYLGPGGLPSAERPEGIWLVTSGLLLAGVWGLLVLLSQRSGGVSIPLALAMATLCTGLSVLLAGYLKGGAAAFPLVGTVVGATLASRLTHPRTGLLSASTSPALLGIALVSLFGLLFVGCAYGRLPLGRGVIILLAPLLCWVTEPRFLRERSPWIVGLVRLTVVAIPLLTVLGLAKRDFDRNLAPLVSGRATGFGEQ